MHHRVRKDTCYEQRQDDTKVGCEAEECSEVDGAEVGGREGEDEEECGAAWDFGAGGGVAGSA